MPTNLRRLGVFGENLPVKKARAVVASDFLIGGIMGQFERKYDRSYLVNNIEEFQEIFGNHVASTFYGWDAVKGFFDNVMGVDAKLYVAAYVGTTGGSIDAMVAIRTVQDTGVEDLFTASAGYLEEDSYGVAGNRTAIKITLADRFATEAAGTVAATGEYSAELDSVIGIKVGDIVKFDASGGTPGIEYHKITAVDESAKTVTWVGDFSLLATLAVGDAVTVPGFTIQTYRKSITGIEVEVEEDLGRIVCTMEAEVADYYAPNVHATNRAVVITDEASVSTLGDRLPSADSVPVYLVSGADGTAPAGAASWADTLALFDDDPVRVLTNPEETAAAIHTAGEAYCKARSDTPVWLPVMAEDQTKAQLITAGNGFQRSDEVDMVLAAQWLKVEDPFASSPIAPARHVPNVGHVLGNWIRSIGQNGIHFIPAVKTNPLRGIVGIVGDQFLNDLDRTDIAENGVNLIQDIDGVGIIIRNFFTPSIDVAYQFANGILMRNYIKVSSVDSLQPSENKPNSINRIREDKMAILQFLYRLWDVGSTGNVPTGETFGQTQTADGTETSPEDHFEVKADLINNPQSSINAGERNLDTYFTYPSPAGSIKIGVGILLLA